MLQQLSNLFYSFPLDSFTHRELTSSTYALWETSESGKKIHLLFVCQSSLRLAVFLVSLSLYLCSSWHNIAMALLGSLRYCCDYENLSLNLDMKSIMCSQKATVFGFWVCCIFFVWLVCFGGFWTLKILQLLFCYLYFVF